MNKKKSMAKIVEISKEELSTEKVELAKISDLENIDNQAKEIIKDIEKLSETLQLKKTEWNETNKQYKLDIASAKSMLKAHNNLIDDLQRQAQELGLTPNDVPQLKESINLNGDLRAVANDMQNYSNL